MNDFINKLKAYWEGLSADQRKQYSIGAVVAVVVLVVLIIFISGGAKREFEANTDRILGEIRGAIASQEYAQAVEQAERYLGTENPQLLDLHKRAKTAQLLAELRVLPVEEYYENLKRYKELVEMYPDNVRYRDRLEFYTEKVQTEGRRKGD